jgi:hypothetical protein
MLLLNKSDIVRYIKVGCIVATLHLALIGAHIISQGVF